MPRFLVVDDEPAAVKAMSKLLVSDGHDVTTFTAGAHAVEALSHESFDAVVTDLEMPHVDGHAVVRATREHQPHACVVVIATTGGPALHALMEAGACIVADKPAHYDEVAKTIRDCRATGGHKASRCHMRSRHHEHLVRLGRK